MCKGILNESISQYAFFGRLPVTAKQNGANATATF